MEEDEPEANWTTDDEDSSTTSASEDNAEQETASEGLWFQDEDQRQVVNSLRESFPCFQVIPFQSKESELVTDPKTDKSYRVCKDFRDSAPRLGKLRVPPIPISWPDPTDTEAYKLVDEVVTWQESRQEFLMLPNNTSNTFINFSRDAFSGKLTMKRNQYHDVFRKRMAFLFGKAPLGPESLFSSSNLRVYQCHGLNDRKDRIAYCARNSVVTKAVKQSQGSLLRNITLDEESTCELVNYEVKPLNSIVYGLCPIPKSTLMALRHKKAASLLDLDGDIKKTWFCDYEVNDIICLRDFNFIAQVERSGTIMLLNMDTLETMDVFEKKLFARTRNFNWSVLDCHETRSSLRIATRKEVSLFDIRNGKDGIVFYANNDDPGLEVVTGITKSSKQPHYFYASTSDGIHLVDERNNKGPLQTWLYYSKHLPTTCDSITVNGIEYVCVLTSHGEFHMLANDWTHQTCQPTLNDDTPLACQIQGMPNPYPVTRGRVTTVSFASDLQNIRPLSSFHASHSLQVPWKGISFYSKEDSVLSLLIGNVVGTILCCEIEEWPVGENDQRGNHVWLQNELPSEMKDKWHEQLAFWENEMRKVTYVKSDTGWLNHGSFKPKKLILKNRAKAQEEKEKKSQTVHKGPCKGKIQEYNTVKGLPLVEPLDPSKYHDPQGKKIAKILGEEPLEELFPGLKLDSDESAETSRSQSRLSSVSLRSGDEWLADVNPMLSGREDDFDALENLLANADFEPQITSTQKSEYSQEDENSLSISTSQVASSQKKSAKKRSRHQAGF